MAPVIAAVPVLAGLVLLVGLRWPAARAMSVCGGLTAALAVLFWGVPPLRVTAALLEAVVITVNILLILFGALFLSAQLKGAGALQRIEDWIGGLSPDRRIQAVLVAWVMGSFFEGAAGFGTPAAITAPLLVALGFPALPAVALALVGDSVAVVFGAVGTPLLVGMAEALAGLGAAQATVTPAEVGFRAASYDLLAGSLMPLLLVLTLTVGARGRQGLTEGFGAAPFALAVGLAHMAVAALVARTLGPELPSLLGPLAGLAVALVLIRTGWLLPRVSWALPEESTREAALPGAAPRGSGGVTLARAAGPYVLLVALLALSRARSLPLGGWLRGVTLGWEDILGTGIKATLQPAYSPGLLFVLIALLSVPWFRARPALLAESARSASRVALRAAVALVAAIGTVRIFIHSGVNSEGLAAMPLVLADVAASGAGGVWPLLAPWLGALGSFIAGSATFSNMLFGGVQYAIAAARGLEPVNILALQVMGAAAGNMICIHNVVAATAVVNVTGREGEVIRRTFTPMAVYLVIAGLLGMLARSWG
jgi:lactate permease